MLGVPQEKLVDADAKSDLQCRGNYKLYGVHTYEGFMRRSGYVVASFSNGDQRYIHDPILIITSPDQSPPKSTKVHLFFLFHSCALTLSHILSFPFNRPSPRFNLFHFNFMLGS